MAGPQEQPCHDTTAEASSDEESIGLSECLRLLIDDIEDYTILTLDGEGLIVGCSAGAERLCAGTPLGRHFSCLYPREEGERGRPAQDLEEARLQGRIALTGWRVRPDGSRFWAEVVLSALRNPSGQVSGYAMVTHDVTAGRLVEERLAGLEQERERLEQLLSGGAADLPTLTAVAQLTNNAVVITDVERRVVWVNAGFTALTGFTLDEVRGHNPGALLQGPQTDPATVMYMRERLQRGEGYTVEILNYSKTGDQYWLAIEVQPVRDGTGKLTHFIAVQRDVTEQRRAGQERQALLEREQRARELAEQNNRLKDEFLATLSHELRTPLNGILGFAGLLRRGRLDTETARLAAVEIIERNALAQAQLIEDLLDMSSIAAGTFNLDVQPVEMAEVVSTAIAGQRTAAEAKRIRLDLRLDPSAGLVSGDRRRLLQAVANLLSNAVKFTPPDGRIAVSMRCVANAVEIAVADTGIGIGPEFLPYVFERFRQADGSSTRLHGGLGLGLSLVRHIVEIHGGSVQVQSAGQSQGATFTVRLPLMPVRIGKIESPRDAAEAFSTEGLPPEAADWLAGLRVLVVDNDLQSRRAIQQVLHGCKAEVVTADSAGTALGLLERLRPDVLIVDLGVGGTEGYALLEALPAQNQMLPVLAVTACATARDRARAFLSGIDALLNKPAEPIELAALVANLGRRSERYRATI
ncbi:ATP-binding protein [Gloeobacter morelensis]|uniref:histidine kinase n=1 Tax=Gloeobacter morelensis MG652769 TaxID=2781736 RepID=A0ABY3PTP9_9CYAN|nr:ATP-binding protein [Gloeobacter morelensis]UFP96858.1 PAS domain S-box protein [Gloeobacter morelensis MG652769]